MRRPGTLLAVLAGTVLAVFILYVVWAGILTQAPSRQQRPATGGDGTQMVNGLSYATENVSLPGPSGSGSWTPATAVVFENVTFSLWTVGWTSAGGVMVEGTALEPNGAWVGFAFDPQPGFDRWFAADGVFGVGNMSVDTHGASVRLYVAKPILVYAYQTGQLEYPAPNGTPVVQTFVVDNVTFNLSVTHMTLGGPWLLGTARMPNGTEFAINMSAGGAPPVACSISDGMPDYWGGAICREWSSAWRSVGVLWSGLSTVGLLVLDPPER